MHEGLCWGGGELWDGDLGVEFSIGHVQGWGMR